MNDKSGAPTDTASTSGIQYIKFAASGRNRLVTWIALLAALGGFLFGYDTGIIGQALPFVQKQFHAGTITASWIVASVLVGAIVGAACSGYLAEQTPPKIRGGTVSYNQLMITLGILLAYVAGFGLASVSGNWRWMLGLGAIPGAVLAISMIFVPHTPRWLANQPSG
jgi:MFS family permease